ncbi:uncharacterized protein ACWYII_015695 [Salvelinus alpinus]
MQRTQVRLGRLQLLCQGNNSNPAMLVIRVKRKKINEDQLGQPMCLPGANSYRVISVTQRTGHGLSQSLQDTTCLRGEQLQRIISYLSEPAIASVSQPVSIRTRRHTKDSVTTAIFLLPDLFNEDPRGPYIINKTSPSLYL